MPKNKNAIIRYQILDELLSDSRHYYTRCDLFEKCNQALSEKGYPQVTKRTIELDLKDIDTDFQDIEISHFKKDGKGVVRYSNPAQSIFNKKLSREEALFLSDVLNSLGEFSGLEHFGKIELWRSRLPDITGICRECKTSSPAIVFSENPYLNNGSELMIKNALAGLFTSIVNKVAVRLEYQRFCSDNPDQFDVFPYQLRQYSNRWYLICRLTKGDRDFLMNLALDRIKSFKELPEVTYEDCFCDIDDYYEDIIGITRPLDAAPERILFAVSPDKLPYVTTKPLHGSQTRLMDEEQETMRKEYPSLAAYTFFRIECIPNHELKETFLSFDKGLVMLHPELMKEIRKELDRQRELYDSLTGN